MEIDLTENNRLVDLTTHKQIPVEVLANHENVWHVHFLDSDIPAVAYKCFKIQSETKSNSSLPPELDKSLVIENAYYRVTIDAGSGAIDSVLDRQLNEELVDGHSAYKFGQYLYVTGSDGNTRIINPFKALPLGI